MALAALAYTYCAETDVQALLSIDGEYAGLDDNADGTVNTTEQNYLLTQGINWATSRVNFFCQQLYDGSDLSTSWLVNEWATILAARWVRSRRGNSPPQSLQVLYDEAIKDMREVRAQQAQIPDIGYRNQMSPAWSNIVVDPRYRLRQIRVQRPISEPTQAQHPRALDWQAEWQGTSELGY